ncbi:MAG: 1-acyl-sn-glycerol-3-phosphate acyltransferase, partial [Streptosporangiaceae bacterium]
VHAGLLRWVLSRLRRAAGALLGFRVLLEEPPGEGWLDGGPLLLLARHAGPGDSFALVELLLSRYQRTPRIVLKDTLRWDPGVDVILSRLGACFLPPSAGAGEALPERLAGMAAGLRGSDAMLIFPEGGNWTPHRYQRAIDRLRRRGHHDRQAAADAELNPHVLPPRPAGVLAILAARPDVGIVVIAHTGLDYLVTPGQLWQALPLRDRPMTVRWWYVPPGTVPHDQAAQYRWLRVQWTLVDSWIGARKAQSGAPDAVELTGRGPAVGEVADGEAGTWEEHGQDDPVLDVPG